MALTVGLTGVTVYSALKAVKLDNQNFGSTTPLETARKVKYGGESALKVAIPAIELILGKEYVLHHSSELKRHGTSDWSTYANKENEYPQVVVLPSTTEEVSEIMKIAHANKIPVIGYSGGTSLEGQFAALEAASICVDFQRMEGVIELHEDDLDVVVGPATEWQQLNEELAPQGLFFPPDPGPGARIGGMISTACSGTNAARYGTVREWIVNLTVVLADGSIVKTRQRPRKSSAGYNLTQLIIGAEGTLGLVTEATLKLAVRPQETSVAVAAFGSISDASRCVSKIVRAGIPVAAVEILDDVQMKAINLSDSVERQYDEVPTLFFKFGGTQSGVKEQIAQVSRIAKDSGLVGKFLFAKSKDEQDELWSARKEALWSVMALKEDGDRVWTTDVAVPVSRLAEIIETTKRDISESGLLASIVGHVGDGNFHAILCFPETKRAVAEAVVHRMVDRALEMEGTSTGEHGVGVIKRDFLEHELGIHAVDMMRKIKTSLDPLGILNPGKIVRLSKE